METPNVLLGQEKLSIYPTYGVVEILEMLERTRSKNHLEFHGISFNEDTIPIWQKYGEGVTDVEFFDCTFDDANVSAFIKFGANLRRLNYHYENLAPRNTPFHTDTVLKRIVESGNVSCSLKVLSIRVNDITWISANTLPFLFSIFTNVEEFSIHFKKSDIDIRAKATSETVLTSYSILHMMISSKDSVTHLNLRLPALQVYEGFTCRFSKPVKEFLNSSHELDENVYESPNDLIEFCSRRKNLESIQCALEIETQEDNPQKEIFAVNFLQRVLRECPKLRQLSLNIDPSYNVVSVDVDLFTAIVESHLEVLELNCEEMNIADGIESKGNNSTLRSLSLKVNTQSTMISFLKHFTGLKNLKMFNAEDDVLQAIWQYQSSLTSLQLLNVVPYTWAFTGRGDETNENYDPKQNTGFSIDRLKNLLYLNVEAIEPDWNATDDIFDHFIFPNLRYLDLEIMDNSGVTTAMMTAIERNVPLVEAIILRYYNEVSYEVWKQLCERMKHLRYLAILGDSIVESKYTDHEYHNLFSIRPTLRVLLHKHAEGQEVFYYNVIQRKVLKKNSYYIYKERNQFDMFIVQKIRV